MFTYVNVFYFIVNSLFCINVFYFILDSLRIIVLYNLNKIKDFIYVILKYLCIKTKDGVFRRGYN